MIKLSTIAMIMLCVCLFSCSGSSESEQERINENVHHFLMLDDSIQVNTTIEDTVFLENLNEMIAQTEKNLNLIGMDLDTLSTIIDAAAYEKLEVEDQSFQARLSGEAEWKDSIQALELRLLRLQLHQARLKNQQHQFNQTNRVLFRLKRSAWANIGGFHVRASYAKDKDTVSMVLLTDGEFNVVD